MDFEIVIGLEIHTQLATKSKIFSGASTKFGAVANTQACAVDLGLPGVLPVLNKSAVAMAVTFGTAIDAEIGEKSIFARKNYFYPDLPKGYQISQMDLPTVGVGEITIILSDGTKKTIGITRAHLEEDAGKSLHKEFHNETGIDLNRAGTPLLEIVSEPDMRSTEEAVAYAKKIHSLVQYLEISDGNMQEGSFRMDVNISLRPFGQAEYGTRAEIKNLNSFKFMEQAIAYEYDRQSDILLDGGKVAQETRLYDIDKNETRSMRSKEEANDYRYFPDPDLLPVMIDKEFIAKTRAELPELPDQKKQRFIKELGLNEANAESISSSKDLANFFEIALKSVPKNIDLLVNWLLGNLSAALNKSNLDIRESPVSAMYFGGLLVKITDNTISGKIAKTVFEDMWQGLGTANDIIKSKGLEQISDTGAIETMVDEVITNNPDQVAQFKAGKTKMLGFFVGQVMKASQGKANPAEINKLLEQKLS